MNLKIAKIFIAWNHYLDVTSSVSNHTCKRKIHPSIVINKIFALINRDRYIVIPNHHKS